MKQKKSKLSLADHKELSFIIFIAIALFSYFAISAEYVLYKSNVNTESNYDVYVDNSMSKLKPQIITGYALAQDDISTVTRFFNATTVDFDADVLVRVNVTIDQNPSYEHTYYAIEETFPSDWTIVNDSGMSLNDRTFKIVYFDASSQAPSVEYSYVVNAPSGFANSTFSGNYWIEGMDNEENLEGTSDVVVLNTSDITCIPNWACGQWGGCTGTQTRVCVDGNGCEAQRTETQSCTIDDDDDDDDDSTASTGSNGGGGGGGGAPPSTSCSESWNCGLWQKCGADGFQRRSCIDDNDCDTTNDKPIEIQTCDYDGTCTDGIKNSDEEDIDCGGRCSKSCDDVDLDKVPEVELSADDFVGNILDSYILKVNIRNIGENVAKNVEMTTNMWSKKKVEVPKITTGETLRYNFPLNLPDEDGTYTLGVMAQYKDHVIATTNITVIVKIPEYSFKLIKDSDDGKIYAVLIIDNRNKTDRKLSYEYSINKNKETYYLDTSQIDASGDDIVKEIIEIPRLNSLSEGDYEIKSTFYDSGNKVSEETTTFSLESDEKSFNAVYVFIVLIGVVVIASGFIFYKTLNER